jgi:hypothetical protein
MYQNRESYTKWPQNSLNCLKIGQTAVQYSKWPRNIPTKSSSRPSRKYPYLDFWYENILSGNPAMIFYCPLFLQKEAKYITYQSKIETLLATMSTAGNVSFSPRFLTFQTLQSYKQFFPKNRFLQATSYSVKSARVRCLFQKLCPFSYLSLSFSFPLPSLTLFF